jgi:hypothetical protein
MPTLIRLVVILLVLAGLAYGAMFALVIMVQPNEKEVTVRIPARDLLPSPERVPLVQREIDTSRTVNPQPPQEPAQQEPAPAAAEPDAAAAPEAPAEEGSVVTVPPPGIE